MFSIQKDGRGEGAGVPLFACGFVQQACQALLSQPLNLCQTVNVLMLIGVSGSAGRCQGEWEAVNKEITYIHRVIASVCQVVLQRMSRKKEGEGRGEEGDSIGGGSLFYIYVDCLEVFYFLFISDAAITGQAIHEKWFAMLGDFTPKSLHDWGPLFLTCNIEFKCFSLEDRRSPIPGHQETHILFSNYLLTACSARRGQQPRGCIGAEERF